MAKKKKEKREFPVRTHEEFLHWSSGHVLNKFVSEGGPGIKGALITILNMYERNFVKCEKK